MTGAGSPEERFASLAEALLADSRVGEGRMFGSQVLKVTGKVFVMLVKGRLVLKLPAERVQALVTGGAGKPFDPGHGRPSKEWVAVVLADADWQALAREARDFVASASGTRRPRKSRKEAKEKSPK
jgi:TfoX/Sxy family transcriptional regulator of competence genes